MQYKIEEKIFRTIVQEFCVYQSNVFSWKKNKIAYIKLRPYLIDNSPALSHT